MQLIIFDMSGTMYNEFTGELYPEIAEIIKSAHKMGNLLAISTNLGKGSANNFLQEFGLKEYFHTIATADLHGFKPATSQLEYILEDNGCTNEQAILIGDSFSDVQMAKAMKVKCVAVSWHSPVANNILQLKPNFAVSKFAELWQVLGLRK